jgi:hypothetical protein
VLTLNQIEEGHDSDCHDQEILKIGININALHIEYLRLRLVFPTLNKEHTDDNIWAEHIRRNHKSCELNTMVSFVY